VWKEHFPNETNPVEAESAVVALVSSILVVGSEIYYEGGVGKHGDRALISRNARGIVILEERLDGSNNITYNVITAFQDGAPRGTLIGSL